MYNNDRNNVTNPGYLFDNMVIDVLREWRKAGDITDVPRPSAGTAGGTAPANPYQANTTRFVEDASFWRLRNVTLGYTVPASILAKAKLRTARVFIQGQNWWTATKFRSFDPEMTGTTLNGAQYPALVQTTVGLSIGF
jgi:TonB-dependent starch-binding outer membrane protein SusC